MPEVVLIINRMTLTNISIKWKLALEILHHTFSIFLPSSDILLASIILQKSSTSSHHHLAGLDSVFKYKLPFDFHFRYSHAVDDHNNLRHELPSIRDTWVIDRWECRVFGFILVISEVNAFLILR